ncbi:MAG: recombination protein RecR [Desulfovibrio sp.]|nr:recombination protein RecR [Desulfovibrio sp.]
MQDRSIPIALETLVKQLGALPGLGPKSAMRVAMTLLEWPEEKTRGLGRSIATLRDTLHLCSCCCGLTQETICPICSDPGRDTSLLCLVPDWDSMLTLDQGGFYRGHYFVLGGLLAPLDHVDTASLHTEKLLQRLAGGQVKEIILALGSTSDAETTTTWLLHLLHSHYPAIPVSRLAQGIPLGSEVKFMDKETLRQSLAYRQHLSKGM